MSITSIFNRVIEYSFYALFFFVPLTFASSTYELFEFNKMWLVFALTIVIGISWLLKMIIQGKVFVQQTPLDIPIFLFLLASAISTFFSLDMHTSLWGYYSRFNGGLWSTLSYILLYYAFVSNMQDHDLSTPFSFFTKQSHTHKTFLFIGAIAAFVLGFYVYVSLSESALSTEIPWLQATVLITGIIGSFFLFTQTLTGSPVVRTLTVAIISGIIVALWGLPSHFGYDPTCLLLRNSFDVSCWTNAFQPKVRIFSTFGQPNWLAAFLAVLIPPTFVAGLLSFQKHTNKHSLFQSPHIGIGIACLIIVVLFFADILFTGSRSGFLGLTAASIFTLTSLSLLYIKSSTIKKSVVISAIIFFLLLMSSVAIQKEFLAHVTLLTGAGFFALFIYGLLPAAKPLKATIICLLAVLFVLSLLFGTPLTPKLSTMVPAVSKQPVGTQTQTPVGPVLESGGTESGAIRLIVWKGALNAWLHNPIIGTGVETFAYAYYKYRPSAHNLTSEWDYLYNKAHNEYLNYLTTMGIVGLVSYLAIIIWFLVKTLPFSLFSLWEKNTLNESYPPNNILALSLIGSYMSILVSNFLGFSVVMINVFFFLIPAFCFVLFKTLGKYPILSYSFLKQPLSTKTISPHKSIPQNKVTAPQWILGSLLIFVAIYLLGTLLTYWHADKEFAMGYNLNKSGQYETAHQYLDNAVALRGDEPFFQDELAMNNAIVSMNALLQKDATTAASLAQQAIDTSNLVVDQHPNNIVFWKTRVRLFYLLSQIEPSYLIYALQSIQKASELAPTDAKISYNLGVLYGQNGETDKAIETLEKTTALKPDYKDAYYALGLFYHTKAIDKNKKIIHPEYQEKAVQAMNYILTRLSPGDPEAKKALETWKQEAQ